VRKILFVTGSRGEYGYIRPILKLIKDRSDLSYEIVATNMHLISRYGSSIDNFSLDGFKVDYELYMALEGSTPTSMAKSLGIFMMSLADLLNNSRPDIILIAGDRGEQLSAAIVGAHIGIPVAHIQAGELSGNVDGMARHAIARFAHIHFAANEDAAIRLIKSGEEEHRVFMVGAPQIDELVQRCTCSSEEVRRFFHLSDTEPVNILVQHPVTEQFELSEKHMEISLEAMSRIGTRTVLVYPNNDAGSSFIQDAIAKYNENWLTTVRNVPREMYLGLMSIASVIVGNSSSGILEAPSFGLPAINVGRRQTGRYQGKNVINVDHNVERICEAIRKAMDPVFRESLKGAPNPYGDGKSSERIVNILSTIVIDEKLMFKQLSY
jgi:GDP/UDP-N,N'-diacetylbacillosamine 2-epimerase (hydrolysing)